MCCVLHQDTLIQLNTASTHEDPSDITEKVVDLDVKNQIKQQNKVQNYGLVAARWLALAL